MPASPWTLTAQQVIDLPEIWFWSSITFTLKASRAGWRLFSTACGLPPTVICALSQPRASGPRCPASSRGVDATQPRLTVRLASAQPEIAYTVRVWTAGEQIELAVDLDAPLPEEWAGKGRF